MQAANRRNPLYSPIDRLTLEVTRTKHRLSGLTVDWEANWRVKRMSQGSWVSRYFSNTARKVRRNDQKVNDFPRHEVLVIDFLVLARTQAIRDSEDLSVLGSHQHSPKD